MRTRRRSPGAQLGLGTVLRIVDMVIPTIRFVQIARTLPVALVLVGS